MEYLFSKLDHLPVAQTFPLGDPSVGSDTMEYKSNLFFNYRMKYVFSAGGNLQIDVIPVGSALVSKNKPIQILKCFQPSGYKDNLLTEIVQSGETQGDRLARSSFIGQRSFQSALACDEFSPLVQWRVGCASHATSPRASQAAAWETFVLATHTLERP